MCGIAGFVTRSPCSSPDALLVRMTDAIRHRGPDAAGYYRDPFASLGHRRLSIIDVAGGHQPMSNEDGALQIVYNGEIFNHADLRPTLEQAGHRYQTRCDTETILHAYEHYGPDCVTRFRGMFCVRHLGQKHAHAVLRTRPSRQKALLLLLGWPPVRLCLGDQGAARAPRHIAAL